MDCVRYALGQVRYACSSCGYRFHLSKTQEARSAVKRRIEPRDRHEAGKAFQREPVINRTLPRSTLYVVSEFDGELTSGRVQGDGYTADVSSGGCRIESDIPVQMGMCLALLLTVSEHAPPIKIAAARVRWAQTYAFGVEFLRILPADESRLTDLLASVS
jgi:hypothetical protein